ncbi:hypothetical protein NMY22_g11002 [Coprinellus aureogranulatus]|nr:hypothetical protein NMY22_g11002 [Coprinellus aureogranulatus]
MDLMDSSNSTPSQSAAGTKDSLFPHAHDFAIKTFTVYTGTHVHQGGRGTPGHDLGEYLYRNTAPEAIHDSAERYNAPRCLEETREAVQREIMDLVTNGGCDILWLTGPVGAGKSAIAGTIAEICKSKNLLAASFFFSSYTGSELRRYKRYLVPTLAYQIAQLPEFKAYRNALSVCIQRDPAIFSRQLNTQMDTLILGPLRAMRYAGALPTGPAVIIVDGVDEVEAEGSRRLRPNEAQDANERDQSEVISALLQVANDKTIPFRVLVASRPERVIRETLYRVPLALRELFLDRKYNPDADIELFLRRKFAEIRQRYNLPTSWPTEEAIRELVQRASGQFIYASTVIRCAQDRTSPPMERLDMLLSAEHRGDGDLHPLAALHLLYDHVLQTSPNARLSALWLYTFHSFLGDSPALFARQLLEDTPGQAHYLLENLTSLVYIPPRDAEHLSPYQLYHKSLVEYLVRYINQAEGEQGLHSGRLWRFMMGKLTSVLQAKGPVVALSETHWCHFMVQFLSLAQRWVHECFEDNHLRLGPLAVCDLDWWLRVVATVVPDRLASIIIAFFEASHTHAPTNDPYECLNLTASSCDSVCKLWRRSILKFCRGNGWTTPDAVALLRELMCTEIGIWRDANLYKAQGGLCDEDAELQRIVPDHMYFQFNNYFSPQEQGSQSILKSHANQDPDGYDSLLGLVGHLYHRLPNDWRQRYLAELDRGISIHDILESEIDEILPGDSGDDVEGVLGQLSDLQLSTASIPPSQ